MTCKSDYRPSDDNTPTDRIPARSGGGGRQRSLDRGLPADEALRELARTYLQAQRAHWPELVSDGTLPAPADLVLADMASKFKQRFLKSTIEVMPEPARPPWSGLACSYLRYSCDRSNPRSLDQQLGLQLERAARERHFVPWSLVFADAAVTGTMADRTGYKMAKKALELRNLAAMYIDEVGRASRDAIEALKLGRLVDQTRGRLIGVSDAFDSASPASKLMLSMFSMLHEWFVDQLRSKVKRGMDDAFHRGTNLHGPSFGYRLEPATDDQGGPLLGADGETLNRKVVEPAEAAAVVEAYRLFLDSHTSPGTIARQLNESGLGGQRTWEDAAVRKLLRRRTYVGIEVYRNTQRVVDPETGKITIEERPRSEWMIRRVRHLQIIPLKTWKAARKKLEAAAAAWSRNRVPGRPSRCELYPSVLIRPRCGSCNHELMLGRSGHYGCYCCLNGIHGRHGCSFKGYKSVRIVEASILGYLRDVLCSPEFVAKVVESANGVLAEATTRTPEDPTGLEKEIRSTLGKRDRLMAILEGEDTSDLRSIRDRIAEHERHLTRLRGQLAELKARNTPPPPALTHKAVLELLGDLRGLLERDIAASAVILRELTGPIVVTQEVPPSKKKPVWSAHFTLQGAPAMVILATSRQCPTSSAWEYLKERGWTMGENMTILLEAAVPREVLAPRVAELAAKGASIESIAQALGSSWMTVKRALELSRSGPIRKAAILTSKTPEMPDPPYKQLAEQVKSLRETDDLSFKEIGHRLGVTSNTASRAYQHLHRDARLATLQRGEKVQPSQLPTKPKANR